MYTQRHGKRALAYTHTHPHFLLWTDTYVVGKKQFSRSLTERHSKIKNLTIQLHFIYDFQPDPSEFCINREQVSGGDLSDALLVILQQIISTLIGIFKKAYMKFLTYA